eukprot:1474795-Pleurochrysis_carterae.AAC.1
MCHYYISSTWDWPSMLHGRLESVPAGAASRMLKIAALAVTDWEHLKTAWQALCGIYGFSARL